MIPKLHYLAYKKLLLVLRANNARSVVDSMGDCITRSALDDLVCVSDDITMFRLKYDHLPVNDFKKEGEQILMSRCK